MSVEQSEGMVEGTVYVPYAGLVVVVLELVVLEVAVLELVVLALAAVVVVGGTVVVVAGGLDVEVVVWRAVVVGGEP